MENRTLLIFTGQILLAISLIVMTLIGATTFKQIKLKQGSIHVKGCAEKQIHSDYVIWQGYLSTIAATQNEAYEKLEKDMGLVKHYLEEKGIDLNTVAFSAVSTMVKYHLNNQGHALNTIEGYELGQNFTISSSDIPLITQIAQNITMLIKEGISINSYSPQYFYTRMDELKISMLGEAAKDALLRANELVKHSGAHVGILRSAQQGVFQITPPFSASVSDYGEFDTSSIEKQIKAVVTMEYGID